ncbi:MAG TPA: hypothetical protein ENI27_02410 [bacterium]|nr:hypothetical protein [bacterium]
MTMFQGFELAKLLATTEGRKLITTLQRLVASQGKDLEQVMRESIEHMEKLEEIAKKRGKTLKQVADESLKLYEATNASA